MVFARSLYASAVCLLAVLFQISLLFFLAGAPLLAFLQIMIYAGAVMVLVVVTIMVSPLAAQNRWSGSSLPKPLIALGLALPALELAWAAVNLDLPAPAVPAAGPAIHVGAVLFGPYAVATEAAALLLFLSALAMVDRR